MLGLHIRSVMESPRQRAVLRRTDAASVRGNHGYCTSHRILNCLAVTVLCLFPLSAAPAFDYAGIEQAIREHRFSWAQQRLESHLSAEPGDFRAHILMGVICSEQNQIACAVE